MDITRRRLLAGSLTGAAALAMPAAATPKSAPAWAGALDAAHLGVRPGAEEDQSVKLQRAIDRAARARLPLWLAPGRYRAGGLKLPPGAQLIGARGATHLALTRAPSLIAAEHADSITLSGLTLDGGGQALHQDDALLHFADIRGLRIEDCDILRVGGTALALAQCDGQVTGATISDATDNGLFAADSRGLLLSANTIRRCGNGGIRVWQSAKRHDGTIVADNTIEDTGATSGGTGENGNAINVFRAGGVIVRNNVIRRAAFTAVRGNAAADIQILGNNCAGLGEVAIYSEFGFEGAVIADNMVDGAAFGVSVTNFNDGGRLAVVQGNVIRNLLARRPQGGDDFAGVGISVEADTAVTGNVIDGAPFMGISLGYGQYLRDVTVSGNVVRTAGIGIGVSVSPGAGDAAITGNLIAAKRGAIVGMDLGKPATADLATDGAQRYPQLTIANNRVR